MKLSHPSLLRNLGYINGKWVAAADGKTFPVLNPFDNRVLAEALEYGMEEYLEIKFLCWGGVE